MIICSNCGRENEDEFKFCLGCGSGLEPPKKVELKPEMMSCPHCGNEVPGGFKFCGACGGSLEVLPAQAEKDTVERTVQAAGPAATGRSEEEEQLGELTVIRPDGTEGARIPLTTGGVVLGRDSDFEVLANDPFLSPKHAEVRFEGGILKIRDLDSVNGIFWRLRDDLELEDGDLIRIGQELLRFQHFSAVDPLASQKEESTKLQGSPDPGVWARLSLMGGPEVETRAFAISGSEATIGREIGTVLFREDGFVSGKHARIYRDNGKVFLRDLGSSNGSYVRIRKERRLSRGDLVLMGQQLFRVSIG